MVNPLVLLSSSLFLFLAHFFSFIPLLVSMSVCLTSLSPSSSLSPSHTIDSRSLSSSYKRIINFFRDKHEQLWLIEKMEGSHTIRYTEGVAGVANMAKPYRLSGDSEWSYYRSSVLNKHKSHHYCLYKW